MSVDGIYGTPGIIAACAYPQDRSLPTSPHMPAFRYGSALSGCFNRRENRDRKLEFSVAVPHLREDLL
jgi:hypothetical protein